MGIRMSPRPLTSTTTHDQLPQARAPDPERRDRRPRDRAAAEIGPIRDLRRSQRYLGGRCRCRPQAAGSASQDGNDHAPDTHMAPRLTERAEPYQERQRTGHQRWHKLARGHSVSADHVLTPIGRQRRPGQLANVADYSLRGRPYGVHSPKNLRTNVSQVGSAASPPPGTWSPGSASPGLPRQDHHQSGSAAAPRSR